MGRANSAQPTAHRWPAPELRGPFQAEMLTVWLIRAFTVDLVDHLAAPRGGPGAVTLNPDLRRSWGLAMPPGWAWRRFWSATHPF